MVKDTAKANDNIKMDEDPEIKEQPKQSLTGPMIPTKSGDSESCLGLFGCYNYQKHIVSEGTKQEH